jgi:hypothetical protein
MLSPGLTCPTLHRPIYAHRAMFCYRMGIATYTFKPSRNYKLLNNAFTLLLIPRFTLSLSSSFLQGAVWLPHGDGERPLG